MEADHFVQYLGRDDQTTLTSYLGSPKFMQASANSTRLVNKLKIAVENEAFYETQQILRTIYFRFININEKVDALTDLLYYGSMHLLGKAEYISGQDLAILFLESASKKLQACSDATKDSESDRQATARSIVCRHFNQNTLDIDVCRKISSIAVLLPDTEIGQTKFVAESLRHLSPKILNRDLLHEILAIRLYQVGDYANSRYHFLHSACVSQHAVMMLVDFHTIKGLRSEVDLFIAQFVLQYLCLQRPADPPVLSSHQGQVRNQRNTVTPSNLAVSEKTRTEIKETISNVFHEYVLHNRHPDLTSTRPYQLPLLNFIFLLLTILDSKRSESAAFKFLVDTYAKVWSRDPNYKRYLDRIGVLYFGLPDPTKEQPTGSGGGGFFNNIIMSLLDGTDDDDDEEEGSVPGARRAAPVMSPCDDLD